MSPRIPWGSALEISPSELKGPESLRNKEGIRTEGAGECQLSPKRFG